MGNSVRVDRKSLAVVSLFHPNTVKPTVDCSVSLANKMSTLFYSIAQERKNIGFIFLKDFMENYIRGLC